MTLLNIFFFALLIMTGLAIGLIVYDLHRAEARAYRKLSSLESLESSVNTCSMDTRFSACKFQSAKFQSAAAPAFFTLAGESESEEKLSELNYDFALAGNSTGNSKRSADTGKKLSVSHQLHITDRPQRLKSYNRPAALQTKPTLDAVS